MKNKINELDKPIKPIKVRPTIEEQIAFVQELTQRSKKNQQELREMIAELKDELGDCQ